MKRYHVFAGDTYHHNCYSDYKRSFVELDDAITYANDFLASTLAPFTSYDWYEILYTEDDGSLRLINPPSLDKHDDW